jgi:hypothetical protein
MKAGLTEPWIMADLLAAAMTGKILRMAKNEKTGAEVARIASKGLRDPGSLTKTEIRKISASVLTQAPDKPKKKP